MVCLSTPLELLSISFQLELSRELNYELESGVLSPESRKSGWSMLGKESKWNWSLPHFIHQSYQATTQVDSGAEGSDLESQTLDFEIQHFPPIATDPLATVAQNIWMFVSTIKVGIIHKMVSSQHLSCFLD